MTRPRSRISSPPSTGRRSPRSSSKSLSAKRATAKRPGRRGFDAHKALSSVVSTPTISSWDLSFSNGSPTPLAGQTYVAPIHPTTPGCATIHHSTATLPFWEGMIRSVSGWAKQTVDPGWWLRELSTWCSEEASRLSAPMASSSSAPVSNPTWLEVRGISTSANGCVGRVTAPIPLSTPSSGTAPEAPSYSI